MPQQYSVHQQAEEADSHEAQEHVPAHYGTSDTSLEMHFSQMLLHPLKDHLLPALVQGADDESVLAVGDVLLLLLRPRSFPTAPFGVKALCPAEDARPLMRAYLRRYHLHWAPVVSVAARHREAFFQKSLGEK